jgi:hypothetical protein
VGWLASHIGAPTTILLQGGITLVIGLVFLPFLRRRELQPKQKMKMEQLEEQSVETT